MSERRRSNNLISFFGYLQVFWLGALRDAANEFTPRSGHWGRLLKASGYRMIWKLKRCGY